MAIIYTYPKAKSLEANDRFIISKMDQEGNPTKVVSAQDLATFIGPLIPGIVTGVSQIVAGTNITISPVIGTGIVTINSTGSVSGTGTTNTLPIWTDGPNGVLGDSFVTQDVGGNIKLRPIDGGGNFSEFTFNTGGTFKDISNWEFRVVNGGFYKKSFKFESKDGISIGRTSISGNVILDVGDPGDTKPAAWFRNGVVVSNNPSGVSVDNTSMVIGAGNNDVVSGSDNCLAVGNNNQILNNSDHSVVFGLGNTIQNTGSASLVVGQGNVLDGTGLGAGTTARSYILGLNNTLTGSFASFIAGGFNTVTTEQNAMVLGYDNTLNGVDNVYAIGENNTLADATANGVFMIGNEITGQDGNMVLGYRNDTAGYPATDYALGLGNTKLVLSVGSVTNSNAIIITEGGVNRGGGTAQEPRIVMPSIINFNFTGDVDAANNGIPIGGIYHNSGELRIRIA